METNVNVLTFAFALQREHGNVFAALHAAPMWPGELQPVRVEVSPLGPMTEAQAAEWEERLAVAFKSRPAREARLSVNPVLNPCGYNP